jgi:hypothetical protein
MGESSISLPFSAKAACSVFTTLGAFVERSTNTFPEVAD